jgi:hypothetical protein
MNLAWVQDAARDPAPGAPAPFPAGAVRWATADAALAWRWAEEGRPQASPWALLTLDDQLAAAAEARALAEGWLADWPPIRLPGVDLPDLCRTPLLYLFRDGLLAGRMIERLLDEVAPQAVAVAGDDLAAGVLRWAARRRGLPLREPDLSAGRPAKGRPATRGRAVPTVGDRSAIGKVADSLRWLAWRPPAAPGAVLVAGGGADYLNQRPVVARLRSSRPWPVVHLALHPPAMAARVGAAQALARPDLVLPPFGSAAEALRMRALGRRAWRALAAGAVPGAAAYPWLLANPWLRPTFRRLCLETLPRAGGAYGAAERLLSRLRPAALLLNSAASPRERALLAAAAARGLPSVQLVHSGFNDLDVHQLRAEALWVWGEAHRRQFTADGLPSERILAVGNPAYDAPVEAADRRSLGLAPGTVAFLLVTAGTPRLLGFVDPAGHLGDLEAICAALADEPAARLLVKPHPRYDDPTLYARLRERWPGLVVLPDQPLRPLLAACDVAVAVNVGTTGALEALLSGRPLVWCRASSRYPPGFDLIAPGALTLDARAAIGPALVELARSAPARAALASRGAAYRRELLAEPPGRATEAVVAALDRVLGRTGRIMGDEAAVGGAR